ncbi:uncharacterized protein CC84DRAFT_1168739 [Paraphaeosphaeria sporulosa]|uniref:Uncharacterized protein n=1 Tax=Paraphaeosphaeria sporulosa TaxID=1460663 RepID=A0A177C0B9_9PLEO|nr:uncharacterized protein CC84DRAFT_1168739 [Paraphaeosphaeria sporulosa]OAG00681.1 hypothetical protein CC84DRAFT_1168739 [Paraphaeosphaeria sporulosa]
MHVPSPSVASGAKVGMWLTLTRVSGAAAGLREDVLRLAGLRDWLFRTAPSAT